MQKLNFNNFYVLGCGNMAGAMLQAFLKSGKVDRKIVTIISSDQNKFHTLQEKYNCAVKSLAECNISPGDVLLIGVKPQIFNEQIEQIKTQIQDASNADKIICLSIMAGVNLNKLQTLGSNIMAIRLMPNLPVTVGHGITGMYLLESQSSEHLAIRNFIEDLLKTTGTVFKAETEEQIDHLTALTGSGPAYLYVFMEALVAAAKGFGFDDQLANKLVVDLIEGAFLYLKKQEPSANEIDLQKLRASVTSKGGTTEVALKVLEAGDFADLIKLALFAAKDRAREISGK